MAFDTLLSGDFARYQRDSGDRPDLLWVFQHVPKTAGSSFVQELSQRLKPHANVHADHGDPARPARETLDESLERFLAELPARRFRFVSGHLRGPQIQRIRRAQPLLHLVTILREPVARVVSDFRYMRTPAHPSHQQAITEFPRFEDYLADPRSQNKMFRFLRRNPKATLEETIEDLEKRFVLVGTLDHYALCGRVLFRLLGEDRAPQLHTRKTESRAENEIPNLEALRPQVLLCNALDQAIYTHFTARLEAVRERLEAWLASPLPARP